MPSSRSSAPRRSAAPHPRPAPHSRVARACARAFTKGPTTEDFNTQKFLTCTVRVRNSRICRHSSELLRERWRNLRMGSGMAK
eukprot:343859-Pleurochrysis_carterae.AAC.1